MKRVDAERLLHGLQPGRASYAITGATLVDDLEAQINETSMWCALRGTDEFEAKLRPPEISPRTLETNRWDAVYRVGDARRAHLRTHTQSCSKGRFAGRFLVYFPDADLCDGAAQAESRGFLDLYNCPPSGSWVGYFEDGGSDPSYSGYLLSWVPEPFLALVDAGVSVNPEECIRWLDQAEVSVRPALRALRLPTIDAPL